MYKGEKDQNLRIAHSVINKAFPIGMASVESPGGYDMNANKYDHLDLTENRK